MFVILGPTPRHINGLITTSSLRFVLLAPTVDESVAQVILRHIRLASRTLYTFAITTLRRAVRLRGNDALVTTVGLPPVSVNRHARLLDYYSLLDGRWWMVIDIRL